MNPEDLKTFGEIIDHFLEKYNLRNWEPRPITKGMIIAKISDVLKFIEKFK